jgi:tetratricopeptide (TPR) repeat protein
MKSLSKSVLRLVAGVLLFSACNRSIPTLAPALFDGMEKPVVEKIVHLHSELKMHPDSSQLAGLLGINCYVHGLKGESVQFFQHAAQLDPKEFRWPYYSAVAQIETGDKSAFDWFDRARGIKPEYVPLSIRLGQAHLHYEEYEAAKVAFSQALSAGQPPTEMKAGGLEQAYLGLATIAIQNDELEEAKVCLHKAIGENANYREGHALLANVYRRLGKSDSADIQIMLAKPLPPQTGLKDPLFSQMVDEGVGSFWHRFRGSNYLAHGLYDLAVIEFRQALESRPDAEAYNNLGFALQHRNKFEEAEKLHRKAIGLDSSYFEAYNNLGVSLYRQQKIPEAITVVEQGIKKNPDFPDAYLNLGTFRKVTGQFREALLAFRKGKELAPENLRFSYQIALLLASAPVQGVRNGAEARKLADDLCRNSNSEVPATLDLLAMAHAECGDFVQAVAVAETAFNLALQQGNRSLAKEIESRRSAYESGQPYREQ